MVYVTNCSNIYVWFTSFELLLCHFEIPPYFGVSFGRQSGVSIPEKRIPVKRPSLPSMYFTPSLVNLQGGKGKGYKIFTRVLQFQPICSCLERGCIRASILPKKSFALPLDKARDLCYNTARRASRTTGDVHSVPNRSVEKRKKFFETS